MTYLNLPAYFQDQALEVEQQGLTLREHYAGLAMQAILAGCYTNPNAEEIASDWVASQAIEQADALIDALEEKNNG